eukprot:6143560-Lingulodinium_polyedra.AAC.1
MGLQAALPPIRAWTDHEAILTAVQRGRVWCCAADRPFAVWAIPDDLGVAIGDAGTADCVEGVGVTLRKVEAR